jgi:hypothetical protein
LDGSTRKNPLNLAGDAFQRRPATKIEDIPFLQMWFSSFMAAAPLQIVAGPVRDCAGVSFKFGSLYRGFLLWVKCFRII